MDHQKHFGNATTKLRAFVGPICRVIRLSAETMGNNAVIKCSLRVG
jgi:hypothetical protein